MIPGPLGRPGSLFSFLTLGALDPKACSPVAFWWLPNGFPLCVATVFIALAREKLGSAARERTKAPNTHITSAILSFLGPNFYHMRYFFIFLYKTAQAILKIHYVFMRIRAYLLYIEPEGNRALPIRIRARSVFLKKFLLLLLHLKYYNTTRSAQFRRFQNSYSRNSRDSRGERSSTS